MSYIITPEFHRNLWLKMSPFRLVAAPVFLLIASMICLNIIPENMGFFAKGYASELMMTGAKWFYFLVVCVWGTHEAANAMNEEVRSNTWDFQRMSSITPSQLVFGKLFGVTSYVWYVGLLALIPFCYGYATAEGGSSQLLGPRGDGMDGGYDAFVVFYMILAGLTGHALAFLVSFIDMTGFAGKLGKKRAPRSSMAFLLGVLVSWMVFMLGQEVAPKLASLSSPFAATRAVEWYDTSYPSPVFVTWSLLFFLFWALMGSYRIARTELMHRTYPVAWMSFVATILVYFRGFANPGNAYYYSHWMGLFVLALLLSYAVMLFEASDSRKYARFFSSLREGDYRGAFENAHRWLVSIPFILICYVVTLQNVPENGRFISFDSLAGFMLAAMLFALRDGLVIHAMLGGKGGRHAGFKVMFYYILAYIALPFLHFALKPNKFNFRVVSWLESYLYGRNIDVEVPEVVRSLAMYYPLPLKDFTQSLLPVALEAGAAAFLLYTVLDRARHRRLRGTA
ncbi:MAG TPA: hypothetical protein VEF76_11185 [Patescibacteria group bacterium]|nr:hypothetical protein [Patescibacteria group bacterium]